MQKNAYCKIIKLKSKKTGKDFEALEFHIDDYSTLAFPTRLEMKYIKNLLKSSAHEEFKNDIEEDADEKLFD